MLCFSGSCQEAEIEETYMKELFTKVWAALREITKGQWRTLERVTVGAVISLYLKKQGKKASGRDGGEGYN